jgi:hypothetical protein
VSVIGAELLTWHINNTELNYYYYYYYYYYNLLLLLLSCIRAVSATDLWAVEFSTEISKEFN